MSIDNTRIKEFKEFKKQFDEFTLNMFTKLVNQVREKGVPTQENLEDNTDINFLTGKLKEHFLTGNFVDSANYCFLSHVLMGDKPYEC